uniref:Fucosyltransferase n=1 Tax=Rhabditophanes sp. KR3021 TaxID=114890 RepID=A0AC35U3N5_9BILA
MANFRSGFLIVTLLVAPCYQFPPFTFDANNIFGKHSIANPVNFMSEIFTPTALTNWIGDQGSFWNTPVEVITEMPRFRNFKFVDRHGRPSLPFVSKKALKTVCKETAYYRHMFINRKMPIMCREIELTILSWTKRPWQNEYELCPNTDCHILTDKKQLSQAHAVLINDFHVTPPGSSSSWLPKRVNTAQLFIYGLGENVNRLHSRANEYDYHYPPNYFNLTYTYAKTSDIHKTYGGPWMKLNKSRNKTNHLFEPKVTTTHFNNKNNTILWFVSHCNTSSGREIAIKDLSKHIHVEKFGYCNGKPYPEMLKSEEREMYEHFYFYIAAENTDCTDYITEKYWKRIRYNSIPIVSVRKIYENHVPPHSFIAMDDFNSGKEMALYLSYLLANETEYLKYFDFRKDVWYKEANTSFCYLCEEVRKLLKTGRRKVYKDVRKWMSNASRCLNDNYVPSKWKLLGTFIIGHRKFSSFSGSNDYTNTAIVPSEAVAGRKRTKRWLKRRNPVVSPIRLPQDKYNVQVLEDAPLNSLILSIRGEHENRHQIYYSMTAPEDSRSGDLFALDTITGDITLVKGLDHETLSKHVLKVTAFERLDPSVFTSVLVIVDVTDVQDNYPIFERNSYFADIREDAPIGTTVLSIFAQDKDSGSNGQVEYFIQATNGSDLLKINSQSGVIQTNKQLDRETISLLRLKVFAKDNGNPPFNTSAFVEISFLDVNDNAPKFDQLEYHVTVNEDVVVPASLITLNVADLDSGDNGKVHFSIVTTSGNSFSIDYESGQITLKDKLDPKLSPYTFVVRAKDSGQPAFSSRATINVHVVDINDHSPIFLTFQTEFLVEENLEKGFEVGRLEAMDDDFGVNGEISYLFKNTTQSDFLIDQLTGQITTNNKLDREKISSYDLEVMAKDRGNPSLNATCKISILVKDVNDNIPIFEKSNYEVTMLEDVQKGAQLLIVKAFDADYDAKLFYKIESGDKDIFSLTNLGGSDGALLRLTRTFNAEDTEMNLVISAVDQGGQKGFANVTIYVNDVNEKPFFIKHSFNVHIPEDSKMGFHVVQMKASDTDRGQNANLTYQIDHTDFLIDKQTGVITVCKQLDRETQSSYTLTVSVTDNGTPPLSTETLLEILLDDVNDNAPKFAESSYFMEISEDMAMGTSFLQVNAVDIDMGSNAIVDYFLEEEDVFVKMDKFRLDRTSGTLRINDKLDRETVELFVLPIIARDRGVPPQASKSTVTIKLKDVNDNAPQFTSQSYTFHIPENMPPGFLVGSLSATDPDIDDNGDIQFKIFGGLDAKFFDIGVDDNDSKTIHIYTRVEFDYEDKINKFHLELQASSKQLSSTVPVHIFVTDKNDNSPQLREFILLIACYSTQYLEDIGSIPAFDPDQNATLTYFLEANQVVSVDENTGKLNLLSHLNRHVSLKLKTCVSDGPNTVCALAHVKYHPISVEGLEQAVGVVINGIKKDEFLDVDMYRRFVGSIAMLNSHWVEENVVVFDIQEVNGSVVVHFFITEQNGMINTWRVEELVSEAMGNISSLLGRKVEIGSDEVCNIEPCPYYQKCRQTLRFVGPGRRVYETDNFIFKSFESKKSHRCECPSGFGTVSDKLGQCNAQIDMCYADYCKNNGTCLSLENGYHCQCLPNFSGKNCEISVALDTCLPTTCHSDSVCIVKGRSPVCQYCKWHESDTDSECKLRALSFSGDGYLVVPITISRFEWHITLKVATIAKEGLIMYAGERGLSKSDHLMVTMKNGLLTAEISLGNGLARVSMEDYRENRINDGNWRIIHLIYYKRQLVISLDGCDWQIALSNNNTFGYSKCAGAAFIELPKKCNDLAVPCNRFFDVKPGIYLGGVKSVKNRNGVDQGFEGCVKDFHYDGKLVHFSKFDTFEKFGIVEAGCKQKKDICEHSNPCTPSTKCINKWNGHVCQCRHRVHSTTTCKQESSISLFADGAYATWKPLTNAEARHFYFEFRTRERSTQVMVLEFNNLQQYFLFSIEGATTVVNFDSEQFIIPHPHVSDGSWHSVGVSLNPQTNEINMTIDAIYTKIIPLQQANSANRIIQQVYTGQSTSQNHPSKFKGCIRNVEINSYRLKIETQSKTKSGCQAIDECASNSCPVQSKCVRDWDRHSCRCNKGYVGDECVNICNVPNVCGNKGICVPSNSTFGYDCLCSEDKTGRNCEKDKPYQVCPHGFYGAFPNCKECSCDSSKGFLQMCNSLTGACECAVNQYLNNSRCVDCECGIGSSSAMCQKNGQCPCVGEATGRKCDRCENYLELLDKKTLSCVKVKGKCPSNSEFGIQWPTISFGAIARQSCPYQQIGIAFRKCNNNGKWFEVNLDNCTLARFHAVKDKIWETDSVLDVTELASLLNNSTKELMSAEGKNIDVWFSIMDFVLSSNELKNSHINSHVFSEDMITAVSEIARESDYSKQLRLLQQLYSLGKELANVHYDYPFLQPFQISKGNLVFSVDKLDQQHKDDLKYPAPIKLPKFNNFIDKRDVSLKNVNIELTSNKGKGIVYYLVYKLTDCPKCESLAVSIYQKVHHTHKEHSQDINVDIAFPIKEHSNWRNYECVKLVEKPHHLKSKSLKRYEKEDEMWIGSGSDVIGLNDTHVICQFTSSGVFTIFSQAENSFQIQFSSNLKNFPYLHEVMTDLPTIDLSLHIEGITPTDDCLSAASTAGTNAITEAVSTVSDIESTHTSSVPVREKDLPSDRPDMCSVIPYKMQVICAADEFDFHDDGVVQANNSPVREALNVANALDGENDVVSGEQIEHVGDEQGNEIAPVLQHHENVPVQQDADNHLEEQETGRDSSESPDSDTQSQNTDIISDLQDMGNGFELQERDNDSDGQEMDFHNDDQNANMPFDGQGNANSHELRHFIRYLTDLHPINKNYGADCHAFDWKDDFGFNVQQFDDDIETDNEEDVIIGADENLVNSPEDHIAIIPDDDVVIPCAEEIVIALKKELILDELTGAVIVEEDPRDTVPINLFGTHSLPKTDSVKSEKLLKTSVINIATDNYVFTGSERNVYMSINFKPPYSPIIDTTVIRFDKIVGFEIIKISSECDQNHLLVIMTDIELLYFELTPLTIKTKFVFDVKKSPENSLGMCLGKLKEEGPIHAFIKTSDGFVYSITNEERSSIKYTFEHDQSPIVRFNHQTKTIVVSSCSLAMMVDAMEFLNPFYKDTSRPLQPVFSISIDSEAIDICIAITIVPANQVFVITKKCFYMFGTYGNTKYTFPSDTRYSPYFHCRIATQTPIIIDYLGIFYAYNGKYFFNCGREVWLKSKVYLIVSTLHDQIRLFELNARGGMKENEFDNEYKFESYFLDIDNKHRRLYRFLNGFKGRNDGPVGSRIRYNNFFSFMMLPKERIVDDHDSNFGTADKYYLLDYLTMFNLNHVVDIDIKTENCILKIEVVESPQRYGEICRLQDKLASQKNFPKFVDAIKDKLYLRQDNSNYEVSMGQCVEIRFFGDMEIEPKHIVMRETDYHIMQPLVVLPRADEIKSLKICMVINCPDNTQIVKTIHLPLSLFFLVRDYESTSVGIFTFTMNSSKRTVTLATVLTSFDIGTRTELTLSYCGDHTQTITVKTCEDGKSFIFSGNNFSLMRHLLELISETMSEVDGGHDYNITSRYLNLYADKIMSKSFNCNYILGKIHKRVIEEEERTIVRLLDMHCNRDVERYVLQMLDLVNKFNNDPFHFYENIFDSTENQMIRYHEPPNRETYMCPNIAFTPQFGSFNYPEDKIIINARQVDFHKYQKIMDANASPIVRHNIDSDTEFDIDADTDEHEYYAAYENEGND